MNNTNALVHEDRYITINNKEVPVPPNVVEGFNNIYAWLYEEAKKNNPKLTKEEFDCLVNKNFKNGIEKIINQLNK